MNQRFGVVRGLSSGDAYSRYALLYFRSGLPEGTVCRPDPLDESACLAEVQREGETGDWDWVLRYSWRLPEPGVPTGHAEV